MVKTGACDGSSRAPKRRAVCGVTSSSLISSQPKFDEGSLIHPCTSATSAAIEGNVYPVKSAAPTATNELGVETESAEPVAPGTCHGVPAPKREFQLTPPSVQNCETRLISKVELFGVSGTITTVISSVAELTTAPAGIWLRSNRSNARRTSNCARLPNAPETNDGSEP